MRLLNVYTILGCFQLSLNAIYVFLKSLMYSVFLYTLLYRSSN